MTEEEIIAKYNEIIAKREEGLKIKRLKEKVADIISSCDNPFDSIEAKLVINVINMGVGSQHEEEFRLTTAELRDILNHLYLTKGN